MSLYRGGGDSTTSDHSQSDGCSRNSPEENGNTDSDVAANTDCSDDDHDNGDIDLGQPNPVQSSPVSSSQESSNAAQRGGTDVLTSQQSSGAMDMESAHPGGDPGGEQLVSPLHNDSHLSILYSFDDEESSPSNIDAPNSDEGDDKLSQEQTATNDITPRVALSQPNTSAHIDRASTPPGEHSAGLASGIMPQSWSQVDPGVLEKLPPDIRRGNIGLVAFLRSSKLG